MRERDSSLYAPLIDADVQMLKPLSVLTECLVVAHNSSCPMFCCLFAGPKPEPHSCWWCAKAQPGSQVPEPVVSAAAGPGPAAAAAETGAGHGPRTRAHVRSTAGYGAGQRPGRAQAAAAATGGLPAVGACTQCRPGTQGQEPAGAAVGCGERLGHAAAVCLRTGASAVRAAAVHDACAGGGGVPRRPDVHGPRLGHDIHVRQRPLGRVWHPGSMALAAAH